MSDFNRMTIVAAVEVVSSFHSQADLDLLEVQWGLSGRDGRSSKQARVAVWAAIACDEDISVMTENGQLPLSRALVETAICAPSESHSSPSWKKFVAGLRFDGFDLDYKETHFIDMKTYQTGKSIDVTLIRMMPDSVPELNFRETENEVMKLLDRSGFRVAKGHLQQAMSAFQRGEWSSSNGELRNFFESCLNEIAVKIGYAGSGDAKAKRDFLGGGCAPPFLLSEYNEWHINNQKPQYVQGLVSRMHPHGGHPGLSEEDDATFRLQIALISARLFLRRFVQRRAS